MRSLVIALSIGLAIASCQGDESSGTPAEGQHAGPRPDVSLPAVPQMNLDRPIRHPDGSLSIWALSQRRNEYLGQAVRVTAYATDIYICEFRQAMEASDRLIEYRNYLSEDEAEELQGIALTAGTGEGTGDARCLYPHLYVADSLNANLTMLVTGYGLAIEERLVVGDRYVFEGRYLDETRGFNAAGRGLIYVNNISGGSLDLPAPEGGTEEIEIR